VGDRLLALRQHVGVGDQHPHGLTTQRRHVAAAGDDADLALLDLAQAERRRRPADVDLPGHHRRERAGRAPGRGRLGLEAELADEGEHDRIRARAVVPRQNRRVRVRRSGIGVRHGDRGDGAERLRSRRAVDRRDDRGDVRDRDGLRGGQRPVAGISVGLVAEFAGDGSLARHAIFTDIIGLEDHFGDMDFKLCGTSVGVTGFQLDLKLPGIGHEILVEAIAKATEARAHILQQMVATISAPRAELNPYAPRIETICIPSEKIGLLIGPGGKTIRGIVAESGAEINIEDDGSVRIYSSSRESLQRAKEIIQGMVREITVGEIYQGTVVSIKEFGAFVEVLPGKDGLVHISELTDSHVKKVGDVLSIGDSVWVQCIGIDEKGRVRLSRKAAMKRRNNV